MIFTFTLSVLWLTLGVEGEWGSKRNIIHPPQRSDCARECIDGQPRTCYYYFHIEQYSTMGWSCNNCTLPSGCQCILADGVERSVYTANRMIPGPKIEVCEGDTVVVDVENRIDGSEVTIHWHGIWQRDTQYYDGVPFVTQCPILSGNTFRYRWFARNPGTHFWHAHTAMQKLDGLSGAIIIRQSASRDYHRPSYRNDLSGHVIIINDWFPYFSTETFPGALRRPNIIGQLPHSLLINGKGQTRHPDTSIMTQTPLEVFNVVSGETYRFRLINAMATICPVILTIDQHTLTAIASDGEPFERIVVNGIQSYSGERYDFIFTANRTVSSYWIRVRAVDNDCAPEQLQQLAILRYNTGPSLPTAPRPSYNTSVPQGSILNRYSSNCADGVTNSICLNHLASAVPVDSGVLRPNADFKLLLPFGTYRLNTAELFRPNEYKMFMVQGTGLVVTHKIDTIEYASPPSPIISQFRDVNPSQFCNRNNKPANCGDPCSCTHKIDLPLNVTVELILIDDSTPPEAPHTMHLHGYAFNVMGIGILPNGTGSSLDKVTDLDNRGLLQRRFNRPAFKDTLTVPRGGYAVVRFRASNAGIWFLHCHFAHHLLTGMSLVLQIGSDFNIPPIPTNFPRCGNFLPPY